MIGMLERRCAVAHERQREQPQDFEVASVFHDRELLEMQFDEL